MREHGFGRSQELRPGVDLEVGGEDREGLVCTASIMPFSRGILRGRRMMLILEPRE